MLPTLPANVQWHSAPGVQRMGHRSGRRRSSVNRRLHTRALWRFLMHLLMSLKRNSYNRVLRRAEALMIIPVGGCSVADWPTRRHNHGRHRTTMTAQTGIAPARKPRASPLGNKTRDARCIHLTLSPQPPLSAVSPSAIPRRITVAVPVSSPTFFHPSLPYTAYPPCLYHSFLPS